MPAWYRSQRPHQFLRLRVLFGLGILGRALAHYGPVLFAIDHHLLGQPQGGAVKDQLPLL